MCVDDKHAHACLRRYCASFRYLNRVVHLCMINIRLLFCVCVCVNEGVSNLVVVVVVFSIRLNESIVNTLREGESLT